MGKRTHNRYPFLVKVSVSKGISQHGYLDVLKQNKFIITAIARKLLSSSRAKASKIRWAKRSNNIKLHIKQIRT